MKKIYMFLLAVLFVGCVHVPKTGSVKEEISNIYYSSVSIVTEKNDAYGSGTIIKNNKDDYIVVISAAHVVRGMEKKWQKDFEEGKATKRLEFFISVAYDDNLKKVEVLKIDDDKDLALFIGAEKESKSGPYVEVSNTPPNIGDNIWAIGAPMGDQRTVTNGIVSNFENSNKKRSLYRISAPVFFGNSGGGLFSNKMELIGVINSIQSIGGFIFVPGGSFAVSLKEIRQFL